MHWVRRHSGREKTFAKVERCETVWCVLGKLLLCCSLLEQSGKEQHRKGAATLGNLGFILQVTDMVGLDLREGILATGQRTDLREAELVGGGPCRKLQQQTGREAAKSCVRGLATCMAGELFSRQTGKDWWLTLGSNEDLMRASVSPSTKRGMIARFPS